MTMNRRQFVKTGLSSLAYFTIEATVPNWIVRAANAMTCDCLCDDLVLVILQQAGGNDGLNMVIPRTDPIYYDAATRPTIRIPSGSEINLNGLNGLHPRLANLANWYQRGMLGIVHNVGYVNPDLSHFSATDYFEYGYVPGATKPTQGWAARFFDNACSGAPNQYSLSMMASGISSIPTSMLNATNYTAPAVASANSYSLQTGQDRALRLAAITALNTVATSDPNIDFLQRSENAAEASIADVATAVAQADLVAAGSYQNDSLGNGLKLASQIVRAGFKTRIFYVSQSGYDTHANQIATGDPLNQGDHPRLLDSLDKSVNAFLTEMDLSGNLNRVLVMTFSEFGRRVQENASVGTDHGAANCLMVMGGRVAGGVYGGQPDLTNLIKGNLDYKVDFRSVYSQVIEGWFKNNAAAVFGQSVYDSIISVDLPTIPFLKGASSAVKNWQLYQ